MASGYGRRKPHDLRSRLQLFTWQELAAVLPLALQTFLEDKYAIRSKSEGMTVKGGAKLMQEVKYALNAAIGMGRGSIWLHLTKNNT
ncbi:hypothetical protein HDF16_005214 [Granulicella aggregans]|uniref:Uncharacterized protein n=1 Tax=Granulicella aggregans TaxID=474949 RepID=A0A7W7ZIQ0_9BACT|nr:hypothetical protein [Granulicella aggregans]